MDWHQRRVRTGGAHPLRRRERRTHLTDRIADDAEQTQRPFGNMAESSSKAMLFQPRPCIRHILVRRVRDQLDNARASEPNRDQRLADRREVD